MALRAVFFDVGDTLWHGKDAPPASEFRRIASERVTAALREWGVSHADPAAVARVAWDSLEEAMRTARATDLVEPDYPEVTRQALLESGLALTHGQSAELLDAMYVSGSDGGKAAFADAPATLLELRERGFLLATVTNRAFGGERYRKDLRDAGLDIGWDAHAVSVEVGYLKPHPAIFEFALRELSLGPAEVLMVGNSLAEDVAGATGLGIATAWRRSAPDAEGVIPNYAVDELHELLAIPVLRGCC
jgi:FMN phosphatase YigB (HAD superfamily)